MTEFIITNRLLLLWKNKTFSTRKNERHSCLKLNRMNDIQLVKQMKNLLIRNILKTLYTKELSKAD